MEPSNCPISSDNRFGPQVNSACRSFDFTLVFEDAFFVVLPAAAFLLLSPVRLHIFRKQPTKLQSFKLLTWKLVALALLFALHICYLAISLTTEKLRTKFTIPSGTLAAVAVIVAGIESFLEDQRSVSPSDLLVIYFSTSLILGIPRLRTVWLMDDVTPARGVWVAVFVLNAFVLAVESARKTKFLHPAYSNVTKEQLSGFWDKSFFVWTLPFFRIGYSNIMSLKDIPKIDEDLAEQKVLQRLEAAWQKTSGRYRLLRAAFRAYKWQFLSAVIPRLALTGFKFCQPFLINAAVGFIGSDADQRPESHGRALVGATVLVYFGMAVSTAIYWRQTYRFFTMLRGGLIAMIYRHTTVLTANDVKDGGAITLMGTDVERIIISYRFVHELWASLPEIAIAVYLLSSQLSVASIVPPIICILSVAVISPVSTRLGTAQKNWTGKVQTRVAVTANMLGDMKAVKILNLDRVIGKVVTRMRMQELQTSEIFRKLRIIIIVISNAPHELAPFATFAVYAILGAASGKTLLTAQAFTSLTLISLLAEPLGIFCYALPNWFTALACFQRIETYRLKGASSSSDSDQFTDHSLASNSNVQLETVTSARQLGDVFHFDSADLSWTEDSEAILHDLTATIKCGITMIIGPVASGKSSLLATMLGETTKKKGLMSQPLSRVAFCAQTPWIMDSTVRHNIVCGLEFDQKWYDFTLSACYLEKDLHHLPAGDQSLAGSNGSSLSGGQRQRVALARAVYSRLSIVVLDDCFSGLDQNALSHISEQLLGRDGYFRRARISVVLATHSKRILPFADNIIALDEGRIVDCGTYSDIGPRNPRLVEKAVESSNDESSETSDEIEKVATDESLVRKPSRIAQLDTPSADPQRRNGTWTVYAYYYRSAGMIPVLLWVFLSMAESVASSYTPLWVQRWSDANEKHPNQETGLYVGIYAMLLTLALSGLGLQCWIFFVTIINNTALGLHSDLLKSVLRAPYSFFQTTDAGSITNRFSQDMDLIDMTLPSHAIQFVASFAGSIVRLFIIAALGKYLAVSVPFFLAILYIIQRYYLRTSRQVRLLDIEAKAPLYKNFIETVSGVATIRAFGWQSFFHVLNRDMLNKAQQPFYMLNCIQQWLTLVLDMVVGAIAVILVAIAVSLPSSFSAGALGASLVLILTFNMTLKQTIESWTRLETSIGAVARIQQFVLETPSETQSTDHPAPLTRGGPWPSQGLVEFSNVSAAYASGPPVLRGLSLKIAPGEKIAVCGPSGSGKTSLILSLLRMMDVQEGKITVDDQDLSLLPEQDVRSHFNVISQEPFFMPGTLQFNLDPHDLQSAQAIEAAIQKVGLTAKARANGGIDAELVASEWSHGERQLLCLARALLISSRILILDEATSSVDEETEAIMQQVIEREFREQTVIAVIHRLKYIDRYDRVAMMRRGELIECDAARNLLRKDSALRQLYTAQKSS